MLAIGHFDIFGKVSSRPYTNRHKHSTSRGSNSSLTPKRSRCLHCFFGGVGLHAGSTGAPGPAALRDFSPAYVRFSNRPTEVKRFQTIRRHGVDVARGLALLFGIGTTALPSWDSRIRWNNLYRGLAVR